ncbi:hypothetical protein SCP_0100060 [Sparassis crispa]|uniref:dolichyl-diphosphooligosaccharide--protein glycotransferase n=1 Tax=Sparassis crispa TaxID=139825 RepID=A0A401G4T2_9APHY|nr:hypothetical protein SCP_0100060 [Sparassis crispa]GBE77134.1 hypothetical protein SCP_0100060 [Sparassis crispa]
MRPSRPLLATSWGFLRPVPKARRMPTTPPRIHLLASLTRIYLRGGEPEDRGLLRRQTETFDRVFVLEGCRWPSVVVIASATVLQRLCPAPSSRSPDSDAGSHHLPAPSPDPPRPAEALRSERRRCGPHAGRRDPTTTPTSPPRSPGPDVLCFRELRDEHVFVIIYAVVASYFAGVMVRLMLTLTPVVCVASAIAISSLLDIYIDPTEPEVLEENEGRAEFTQAETATNAASTAVAGPLISLTAPRLNITAPRLSITASPQHNGRPSA